MTDQNTIIAQVNAMKVATDAGKVGWSAMNPTTFQWSKVLPERGHVLTMLQKVIVGIPQALPGAVFRRGIQPGIQPGVVMAQRDCYILSIRSQSGEVFLTLNSQQQPVYEPALRELFQAVEAAGATRGASIISELLKE